METPEKLVFDKAEEAESLEVLRQRAAELKDRVEAAKASLKAAGPDERESHEKELRRLERRKEALGQIIARREKELGGKD